MPVYTPRTIEAYFTGTINPETGFPYDPYPVYVTDEELRDYVGTDAPTIRNVGFDTDGVPYFDPAGVLNGVLIAADTDGTPYIDVTGTYTMGSASFEQLARNPELIFSGAITRNVGGIALSAAVIWPDGTPGTYTATVFNASFPEETDSYTITYGYPIVTRTYTQPLMSRDAAGNITNMPSITVT